MSEPLKYNAVVLGASAGGMKIIKEIATTLPKNFSMPVIVVQHISDSSDGSWATILDEQCEVVVKESDEKETIVSGTVYLAPANYHLLIEAEEYFSLSIDEKVNYARPSIDVLFETAAEAYREQLIGIILTGSNFDGAQGLLHVKENGGLTIVQDPETAEATSMPLAAIEAVKPDYILKPNEILKLLLKIHLNQSIHESQN